MNDIVTSAEIANFIEGFDPRSVASLIKANILPGIRIGYRFATTRKQLIEFINLHPQINLTDAGKDLVSDQAQ